MRTVTVQSNEQRLVAAAQSRSVSIGCAESLTGGLVASLITSVPGASQVFAGGVVAYAPSVKIGLLGIDEASVAVHGTVSQWCAEQMARGGQSAIGCDLCIATTGVAGPDSLEGNDPGTAWVAVSYGTQLTSQLVTGVTGDRDVVRLAVATIALRLGLDVLSGDVTPRD